MVDEISQQSGDQEGGRAICMGVTRRRAFQHYEVQPGKNEGNDTQSLEVISVKKEPRLIRKQL